MFTMNYKRGDVVLVLFPDSNLQMSKRRPAIIVQADNLKTGLAQVIVAMITSNPSRLGHACRVAVSMASSRGKEMGIRTDSIIMTDNLATLALIEIDRRIGKCKDMTDVDIALRHTLKL